jgi:hypothetical protein
MTSLDEAGQIADHGAIEITMQMPCPLMQMRGEDRSRPELVAVDLSGGREAGVEARCGLGGAKHAEFAG